MYKKGRVYNNRGGDEKMNPNSEIPLHSKQLKKNGSAIEGRAEWSWGRKKAQYLTLKMKMKRESGDNLYLQKGGKKKCLDGICT